MCFCCEQDYIKYPVWIGAPLVGVTCIGESTFRCSLAYSCCAACICYYSCYLKYMRRRKETNAQSYAVAL